MFIIFVVNIIEYVRIKKYYFVASLLVFQYSIGSELRYLDKEYNC